MSTPYPREFRRDVVAVACRAGQSRAQVARSFGISESCLARWLRIAERDDGLAGAGLTKEPARAPDTRSLLRRVKQLEQENEILRRATAYFARETLPP